MAIDRRDVSYYTNREGHGLVENDPFAYSVDVKEISIPDRTIAAIGDGKFKGTPPSFVSTNKHPTGGSGAKNMNWGWVSPIGNRVSVDDTTGNENITIQHHTGASVIIQPDGSIFISPSSRRGFGIHSSRGDGTVSAVGNILIDSKGEINIQTRGNLNINAGGDLNLNAGGTLSFSARAFEQHIEGSYTSEIVEDKVEMIGGLSRTTIAGDQRTQISGNNIVDVGNQQTVRIAYGATFDVQDGNYNHVVSANSLFSTGSQYNFIAGANFDIDVGTDYHMETGNRAYLRAGTRIDIADATPSILAAETAAQADTPSAQTIIDTMTTRRQDPLYPENAYLIHADIAAVRKQQ